MQALVRLDTYFFGVISLFSLVTSFSEYGFHRVTLLRNVSSELGAMQGDENQLYIGLTLFSTVGLRQTVHEDEFHITTFFRVRFAREASYLVHW